MTIRIFPINSEKTAFNSTIQSKWDITKQTSASGRERSLCTQYYPNYTISATFPFLTDSEYNTLMGFFNECRGSHYPFYYKDCLECKVVGQTLPKNTDGTYQLIIPHGDYVEPCFYADKISIYVNGAKTTNYTMSNGKISVTASGAITADYEYYYKVRFNGDISFTKMFFNANKVSIKMVTVR